MRRSLHFTDRPICRRQGGIFSWLRPVEGVHRAYRTISTSFDMFLARCLLPSRMRSRWIDARQLEIALNVAAKASIPDGLHSTSADRHLNGARRVPSRVPTMLPNHPIRRIAQRAFDAAGIASMVLAPVFLAVCFIILAALALDAWRSLPVLSIAIGLIACMVVITCVLFAQSKRSGTEKARCIMSMPLDEFGQPKPHRGRRGTNNDASRNGMPIR